MGNVKCSDPQHRCRGRPVGAFRRKPTLVTSQRRQCSFGDARSPPGCSGWPLSI